MATYDINDPTDLDIMKARFDMVTREEWEEYIEIAEENNVGYKKISVLRTAARKAGIAKYLSPKVIHWVLRITEELDEFLYEDEEE